MKLLWTRIRSTIFLASSEKIKTSLDVDISRIKLGCPLISIQSVSGLIVARFVLITQLVILTITTRVSAYQSAEVIPNL
jgi:hypothetical protein